MLIGRKNSKEQQAAKGRMPSKTGINLVQKESDPAKFAAGAAVLVAVFILLAVAAKYLVLDKLSELSLAQINYAYVSSQLTALQNSNSDYSDVVSEYDRYITGDFTDTEAAMQDRWDILRTIADNVQSNGISSIQVSGNTAAVVIESVTLEEIRGILEELEASDIVSYVSVETAKSGSDDEASYVRATLTVVFATPDDSAAAGRTEESEART